MLIDRCVALTRLIDHKRRSLATGIIEPVCYRRDDPNSLRMTLHLLIYAKRGLPQETL